jgi:hypothetical protein
VLFLFISFLVQQEAQGRRRVEYQLTMQQENVNAAKAKHAREQEELEARMQRERAQSFARQEEFVRQQEEERRKKQNALDEALR